MLKFAEKQKDTTGALEEIENERNIPAKIVLSKISLPKKYLNKKIQDTETYSQKRLGVCVGTAHTLQMELLYPDKNFSVRFSYRMAKYLDGLRKKE
jgi:hypothetical protein